MRHSEGASNEDAAALDAPRVDSALIPVHIDGQELLPLSDTGCEVDLVCSDMAQKCNLAVHCLAQPLQLRFADGRHNATIGEVRGVKSELQMEMLLLTISDFHVRPVHHDVILGMRWVTQWKARMRPVQAPHRGMRVRKLKTDCTSQFSQRRLFQLR